VDGEMRSTFLLAAFSAFLNAAADQSELLFPNVLEPRAAGV
jgi:hypothetical protein